MVGGLWSVAGRWAVLLYYASVSSFCASFVTFTFPRGFGLTGGLSDLTKPSICCPVFLPCLVSYDIIVFTRLKLFDHMKD